MAEEGLRDALMVLNRARRAWVEDPNWPAHKDPPFFGATNALIVEIARREGVSIQAVVDSMHEEAK